METKLIVLRGNSGCGKSSIAKRLRELSREKIAIVDQDHLRRNVLGETGKQPKIHNADLIYQTVTFALDRGFHVILEGILALDSYEEMLRKLLEYRPNSHFYYLDASLDETLKRHRTKSNVTEFGEDKIREWYKDKDLTHFSNERVIPESSSAEDTLGLIRSETGL